jgi:biopolymer transport protein ExbB
MTLSFILIALMGLLFVSNIIAQDDASGANNQATEQVSTQNNFQDIPQQGGFEVFARKLVGSGLVDIFIQGGFVMWPILVLVIWALAIIIWKLVALSMARVNLNKFLDELIPLIEDDRFDEAIDLCDNTKGPIASIIKVGLYKVDRGTEVVEKAIENAAIVEMAFLEKGFMALSTTISLAPMLGFFGTVVGMIAAFDAIAKAGEVDPTIVASGIKIALITTAAGLAVAIPVQFFNNVFVSMVDGIVLDMQRGSEKVIEALVEEEK